MGSTLNLSLAFFIYASFFVISEQVKSFDDSILFRINWASQDDSLLENPDYSKLQMISTNNELFECLVPKTYGETLEGPDKYTGPNALELLMPLFKKLSCTLRIESFWTYEVCHGVHIRQYHEERDGKPVRHQEYVLGQTSSVNIELLKTSLVEELRKNTHLDAPETSIESVRMPYFAVDYADGTLCDLTGRPRRTRVLYVCYEDGRHAIYRVKEIFTCEYEITILTSYLCEHPAYRPQEMAQTNLHCFSKQKNIKRPKNLLEQEVESLKLRTQGAILGDLEGGGSVRLEIVEDEMESDDEEGSSATVWGSHRTPFPAQPSIDQKLVAAFLSGEHCLQGGAGWWKYELCYGLVVYQYHEDHDGSKFIIHLGSFDERKHREWISQHPTKKYKRGNSQVSHFYSNGDVCEETGKEREVEVRLRCKEALSPSSVTLYLLEPKVCEYVLGVESPLVCPLLHNADEFGLFIPQTLQEPASKGSSSGIEEEALQLPGDASSVTQMKGEKQPVGKREAEAKEELPRNSEITNRHEEGKKAAEYVEPVTDTESKGKRDL